MFSKGLVPRALLFIALLAPLALACDVSSILTAVGGTPTPVPLPTQAPKPTSAPQPANLVTNAVTAKDVQGDTFDPIGITDSFPANQSIFHAIVTIANAPDNTAVQVVWSDSANNSMGDFALNAGGSRNLDFSFKPNAGTLPAGDYKAAIYVNGALNRTLSFSVSGSAQAQPTAPAQAICASSSPKASGLISQVVMAEDSKGANFDPVNPTVTFNASATFHAIVTVQNAPANTPFKATWCVTNVGTAVAANTLIDSTELVTDGSRNIDFTLKPVSTWPVGTYRVEIMVNGVLDRIVSFSVGASSSGQPTAAPPTQAKPTAAPPTQAKATVPPPTQAKPTVAPTPAALTCGNGVLEPGMVGVFVTNNFDGELLFAIASRSYKIPGHTTLLVQVPGGKAFTYSATITGVGTLTAGPYTFDPGTCVPFTPQN
jgi:hypothetical protein